MPNLTTVMRRLLNPLAGFSGSQLIQTLPAPSGTDFNWPALEELRALETERNLLVTVARAADTMMECDEAPGCNCAPDLGNALEALRKFWAQTPGSPQQVLPVNFEGELEREYWRLAPRDRLDLLMHFGLPSEDECREIPLSFFGASLARILAIPNFGQVVLKAIHELNRHTEIRLAALEDITRRREGRQ